MDKPKILIVDGAARGEGELRSLLDRSESVSVGSIWRGLKLLTREPFAGVYVGGAHLQAAFQAGQLLRNELILEGLPDGVALVDCEQTVLWANQRLRDWATQLSDRAKPYTAVGSKLEDLFGRHGVAVVAACRGALERQGPTTISLQVPTDQPETHESHPELDGQLAGIRHFRLELTPVHDPIDRPVAGQAGVSTASHLVVVARDVTSEVRQQQKLLAIHTAGAALADLTADEVSDMSVEERIILLKENILRFARDLLQFDVIEVRVLNRDHNRLEPLLSVGMQAEAIERELRAEPQGNGVTGFVAATGRSHLCADASREPLYLEGCKGGRSSITVPLLWQDQVIGTFNVESPKAGAFTANDLLFLEIFARDVAQALHTLELLLAEKVSTTAKSVDAIHAAVALPIDTILNDAVTVLEAYIGHTPEVDARLRRILSNARDIKKVVQDVGRKMTPSQALPVAPESQEHPGLKDKRVLVADPDEGVRTQAHQILERYGCVVETAHDGAEAYSMARSGSYYAIISDIGLPDMTGYQLLLKLQDVLDWVPLVLMQGFGWDRNHTMVKARQAGVGAFLSKPFRVKQLLETLETLKPVRGRDENAPQTTA